MSLDRSFIRFVARCLAGLGMLLTTSCSAPSSKPAPAATVADEPAAKAASAPSPGPQDAELVALIERIASGCRIESSILQCSTDERHDLGDQFAKGERSRIAALPTLTALLARDDETLVVVTAELLAAGFSIGFGEEGKPGAVKKEVALGLLEALHRLPLYRARRIAAVTTHAAMLSGQQSALYQTIDMIGDDDLTSRAISSFMVYGRLGVFDTIKEKMAGSERERVSAMTALRHMPEWSTEEQRVLCPWAIGYLEDANVGVGARAAQAVTSCRGEQVDALIEHAEGLHAKGHLDRTRLVTLRDVCKDAQHLSDGRCAKVVGFLRSLIANQKNAADLRTAAIAALHYQVPQDQKVGSATGRALLKQVAETAKRDKDAQVALAGGDLLRHLARAQ